MTVAAVVPAAGSGERLGAGRPKALVLLAGEPIVVHAVRRLAAVPAVGTVVVAAPLDLLDEVRAALSAVSGADVVVVAGGADRVASVAAGLRALPDHVDVVLVHDAARPLVPAAVVEAVLAAVDAGADAVVPGVPVADTVKEVDADGWVRHTPPRVSLRAVQTPQGFRRAVLERAHAAAAGVGATDDAGLVERIGVAVMVVPGDPAAFKITEAADLVAAEALLAGQPEPTGARADG